MKLLIILSATIRGGAEAYALTIARAAAAQWETHMALPYTEGNASLRQDLAINQVTTHRLDIAEPNSRGLRAMGDALVRLLRTLLVLLTVKPDVVLINLPWADHCLGSIVACGLVKMPTAAVFHLLPPDNIPLSGVRRRLYAWARMRHQQWVTNSEANRHLLADLFAMPVSDLLCIYNGTQLPTSLDWSTDAIAHVRQQVRQELHLSIAARLLLTVGRLAPQKGYADLIAIIPSIVEAYPDVVFIWVGEGEQRQDLQDRLQQAGLDRHVMLLGHRTDLPRLLQAADLFLFPTRFEGHPFALLEAMAYRLPIVSTDASSIPEVMDHQVHGLLCRTGDRDDLLQSLDWALQHPEQMQQMAQRALQRVQQFSQATMIEKTLNMLQALSRPMRSPVAVNSPLARDQPLPRIASSTP